MGNKISLKNSFDLIFAILSALGFLAVIQTFVIGKHYIIPTAILFITILISNLSYYGFKNKRVAKKMLFWIFFIFDIHLFFALFYSVKYRAWLGDSFEIICISLLLFFSYLIVQYNKRNQLF
jgi:hypothetical protein